MATKQYDLYLDESGQFAHEGDGNKNPSVIGGLLIERGRLTRQKLEELVPDPIHCMERYDAEKYPRFLERLHKLGGSFVIFENSTERIGNSVLDSDQLYLTMMSEGIALLARMLSQDNATDGIEIAIVAERRIFTGDQKEGKGRIGEEEYIRRIEEHLVLAMRKEHCGDIKWSFTIGSKGDRFLNLADLIVFSYRFGIFPYHTQGRGGFWGLSETQQDRVCSTIDSLYDQKFIFSVLQDSYIENLLMDCRYGDAMYQICRIKSRKNWQRYRNRLLNLLATVDPAERDVHFRAMSSAIRQLNARREYASALQLCNNYEKRILQKLEQCQVEGLDKEVAYWAFDTNFYRLTISDHLGKIDECEKYLKLCDDGIASIVGSWEHLDYYFRYRLRKLNILQNRHEFQEILAESEFLQRLLTETADLFSVIAEEAGVKGEMRSELLGRVLGIRLHALINLIHADPERLSEALEVSDSAMAQLVNRRDESRQQQMRCLLHVEAKQADGAKEWLYRSLGLDCTVDGCKQLADAVLSLPDADYSVLHFTNVMLLLQSANPEEAERMWKALVNDRRFDLNESGHASYPRNMVFWNLSKYEQGNGPDRMPQARGHLDRAIRLTQDGQGVTQRAFELSMRAEWVLWLRSAARQDDACKKELKKAEKELRKAIVTMERLGMTDGMKRSFGWDNLQGDAMSDEALRTAAEGYLR